MSEEVEIERLPKELVDGLRGLCSWLSSNDVGGGVIAVPIKPENEDEPVTEYHNLAVFYGGVTDVFEDSGTH